MEENIKYSEKIETHKSSNYNAKPYVPQKLNYDEESMQDKKDADNLLNKLNYISSSSEKEKDIYKICKENLKNVTHCMCILSSKALNIHKMEAFANMKKFFNPNGTITIIERVGKGFSEKKLTLNTFFDWAVKNFNGGAAFGYGYLKVNFYKGKISEMFISPKEECNNSISNYTDKDFESFTSLIK